MYVRCWACNKPIYDVEFSFWGDGRLSITSICEPCVEEKVREGVMV